MRASYILALGALAATATAVELQKKLPNQLVSAVRDINELLEGSASALEPLSLSDPDFDVLFSGNTSSV